MSVFTQDPVTGEWKPAEPMGPIGAVAKLEFWLRARGCKRLAGLLGRVDEIGLG
jgi:hypothetical protein